MSKPVSVNGHQTFYVDLDRAPELLAELEGVREKYVEAQDMAQELRSIMPPFGDDVTVEVFKKLGKRAQGGEGSLYDTAQGMIDWIDGFKAAVQKAIDEHKRIDEETRMP
ncbi:hypothetical protein [Saccharopolyspora sp. ASAGF58]|uniref:hypothetical protein n=1 Tax=Saccharopolyspora sp. ASAGF58 TaxID=2719023 RepID=UPI00143FC25C|nr:hypothetical protein [Saccharopolyspora sp. ASAGF58]QIZ34297.1 hypothetical protein FDZ84_05530 [Saccharopolyspora sp. ASAGF58]